MKRLLLNALCLFVIAAGGTHLTAQAAATADTPWQTCFNACLAAGHSYDFCRIDCRVFEPKEAAAQQQAPAQN
jgi:hypothetical protein